LTGGATVAGGHVGDWLRGRVNARRAGNRPSCPLQRQSWLVGGTTRCGAYRTQRVV